MTFFRFIQRFVDLMENNEQYEALGTLPALVREPQMTNSQCICGETSSSQETDKNSINQSINQSINHLIN
jgi:hypothetical protein